MKPILSQCPRMKNENSQRFAEMGFAAAVVGKPLNPTIDAEAGLYNIGGRMSWMTGWEYGGGVVTRGIVVTKRMRLEERKAEILAELEAIESQLAESDQGKSGDGK